MLKNKKILYIIIFIQLLIYIAHALISFNNDYSFSTKNMPIANTVFVVSSLITIVLLNPDNEINYLEIIIAIAIALLKITNNIANTSILYVLLFIFLLMRIEERFILGRSHLSFIKEKLNIK